MSKRWLKHLLSLALGLVLVGLLVRVGGTESLREIEHLRPLPLLGALLLTVGITGSIAGRWGLFANMLGNRHVATWAEYYHYFIVSRALGLVLPKDLTDLGGRAVVLNRFHGLSLTHSSAAVLLDRLSDLGTAVIFFLTVLPFWFGWLSSIQAVALLIGVAVAIGVSLFAGYRWLIVAADWTFNSGTHWLTRLPVLRKRTPPHLVIDRLDRDTVMRAYMLSIFKFWFTAGRMVCFALAAGLPISPLLLILGTAPGQMAYLFAFTPGGLGIFEAGWFGILALGDVPTVHIAAFVVAQRVFTVAMVSFLAFVSYAGALVRQYVTRPVH